MRTVLFFIGSTVGSVAFQVTVALYPTQLQHYAWLVKYIWLLWAIIWAVWLASHPALIRAVFGGEHSAATLPPSQATTQINVNPTISPNISPTFINTNVLSPPTLPPNRPKLTFSEWKFRDYTFERRDSVFVLENHGEAALEVKVMRFQIAPNVFAESAMVSTIAKGQQGFALVWIEGFLLHDMEKWDLVAAMKRAADEKDGRGTYRRIM